MDDALTGLFAKFDRGTISRRQLLQALGVAAVGIPLGRLAAQGQCGGDRANSPACLDKTPWKAPFEPTGWKTVLLDHFSVRTVDYKKAAAYYEALMSWKIRSDDGSKAYLDIGDFGGIVIRGGLTPTPPPAPPSAADSAAGRGRGGARVAVNEVWDGFCWGISDWNAKKVEAELEKRGLDPVADNDGKDFESFHVKDPDGFDLQISNGNRKNRRQGPAKGSVGIPAPFEPTGWKTVWLDHISFGVTNYKETTAFYEALLGWKGTEDEGSQNETQIGDIGNVIIRGGNPSAPPGSGRGGRGGRGGAGADGAPRARRASMGHVAFGITPFDPDAVAAELAKRGLNASKDTGNSLDIHDPKARYKSYHTTTTQGFNLQISNATKETRMVR